MVHVLAYTYIQLGAKYNEQFLGVTGFCLQVVTEIMFVGWFFVLLCYRFSEWGRVVSGKYRDPEQDTGAYMVYTGYYFKIFVFCWLPNSVYKMYKTILSLETETDKNKANKEDENKKEERWTLCEYFAHLATLTVILLAGLFVALLDTEWESGS